MSRPTLKPSYDDYSYLSSDEKWLEECQHPDVATTELAGLTKLLQDLKEMKDVGTINKRYVTGLMKRKLSKLGKILHVATVIRFLILARYREVGRRTGVILPDQDVHNTYAAYTIQPNTPLTSEQRQAQEIAQRYMEMLPPLNRLEFLEDNFYQMRGMSENELTWLPRYKRAMEYAVTLIEGENKKQFLLDVCAFLEGSYIPNLRRPIQYITGSKASDATKRRVKIFENVSGILPVKRPERRIKKELQEREAISGDGGEDDDDDTFFQVDVDEQVGVAAVMALSSSANGPTGAVVGPAGVPVVERVSDSEKKRKRDTKTSSSKKKSNRVPSPIRSRSDSSTDIDVDSIPGVTDVQDFGRTHTFATTGIITNTTNGNSNTGNSGGMIFLPPPMSTNSSMAMNMSNMHGYAPSHVTSHHYNTSTTTNRSPNKQQPSLSLTRDDSLGFGVGSSNGGGTDLQFSLSQSSMFSLGEFPLTTPSVSISGLGVPMGVPNVGYNMMPSANTIGASNTLFGRTNTMGSQTIADLIDAAVSSQPDELTFGFESIPSIPLHQAHSLNAAAMVMNQQQQMHHLQQFAIQQAQQQAHQQAHLDHNHSISTQSFNELTNAVFGRQPSEYPGWENLDSQNQD